ncbi:Fe-S cluster assembly sulfur transfer protein SufU [Pectinatus cerevisiiphilus]|uniref:Nitrogen fixation NifU-like protein n=1 Tax=Pectinatus cerevisiiphilus TaxID=86956 RepID=A0A4R3KBH2_9FIRM|nr:SUF system NifU family Fe-S cluster assembly protein [Pectinatus cerevisiiphilus]TCS79981.1 nitrogen fixation NifU-like protein [Pectinatus cerevisiiphilus]
MALNNIYNEILMEHNAHPDHKHKLSTASDCKTAINPHCGDEVLVKKGINPTCGDEIILELNVEDGVIKDAAFNGQGCAISQASTDIMVDLIIGKKIDEAIELTDLFIKMVRGEEKNETKLEELDEAMALKDVSHMPARVKCAVLAWHTLNEMLKEKESQK